MWHRRRLAITRPHRGTHPVTGWGHLPKHGPPRPPAARSLATTKSITARLPMKIMLATAGLLTEAAMAACGSSGPSPAYQKGYDYGTSNHAGREGAKEDTAPARQNGEAMCSLLVAKVG